MPYEDAHHGIPLWGKQCYAKHRNKLQNSELKKLKAWNKTDVKKFQNFHTNAVEKTQRNYMASIISDSVMLSTRTMSLTVCHFLYFTLQVGLAQKLFSLFWWYMAFPSWIYRITGFLILKELYRLSTNLLFCFV